MLINKEPQVTGKGDIKVDRYLREQEFTNSNDQKNARKDVWMSIDRGTKNTPLGRSHA